LHPRQMPTKESLIKELIQGGYLKDPSLIEAFRKIDRADFVPDDFKNGAYLNEPLPIGFGQTISQPLTVAFMLELLEPKTDEKILDVGAGSGWVSALLAYCVSSRNYAEHTQTNAENSPRQSASSPRKSALIIAVERIPEICELGKQNISKYDFIEKGIVKFICADASRGYAKEAPYDKIIAAAAAGEIPSAWKEELKIGGRLVMPLGNSVIVLDKISQNEFEQKEFFGFNFVPLIKGY